MSPLVIKQTCLYDWNPFRQAFSEPWKNSAAWFLSNTIPASSFPLLYSNIIQLHSSLSDSRALYWLNKSWKKWFKLQLVLFLSFKIKSVFSKCPCFLHFFYFPFFSPSFTKMFSLFYLFIYLTVWAPLSHLFLHTFLYFSY